MPLSGHLRELRRRLAVSALAIALAMVAGWYAYPVVFEALTRPYVETVAPMLDQQGISAQLTITGVTGAFIFQLKLSFLLGAIISSPIWLWQIWAFVLPALHKHERRWVALLTIVCLPLFAAGVWLGIFILPPTIRILLGFTPDSVLVLTTLGEYLSFVLQLLLAFGIAAQIPVVVVVLRMIGAVSAAQLRKWRPYTIVGIFIFAAAATPTADPWTMSALAIPMTLLYLIAEFISVFIDRAKRRRNVTWSDDEASPLE